MLVSGRYDESRGDPQIIADSVSLDFNSASAADSIPQPIDDMEPDWANGHAPPDAFIAEFDGPPPPDLDSRPPPENMKPTIRTFLQPSLLTTSAPHNRTSKRQRRTKPNRSGPMATAIWICPGKEQSQERTPRTISVMLVATGDPVKDRRKLTRIHNVLVEYPGVDHFKIVVMRGPDSIPISFPDQTTNICEALQNDLVEIVGSEEFIIIEDEA